MKRLNKLLALCICVMVLVGVCTGVQAENNYASGQLTATEVKLGDTVTLTVSTNEITARAFVVLVEFDSEFEFVDAKWLMSGTQTVYDAAKHKGTLNLGSEKTVSGAVFQVTLKTTGVSATAKNISVTLRANNTSGVAQYEETVSGAVTIVCEHSYGSWTKKDGDTHTHTCSKCGKTESEKHSWKGEVTKVEGCNQAGEMTYTCTGCGATKVEEIAPSDHLWDDGKVTKAATCAEAGTRTYKCASCGTTKTETIPVTSNHSYGQWTKVDGTNHTHECSVCHKTETASHRWDSGKVTKAATCAEAGEKTYTCGDCGATKTEAVEKLTTHQYDNDCDGTCNVCGNTRTVTHKYRDTWSTDGSSHWHSCSVCGDRKDESAHTPGAAATETQAQTCTVCGYVLQSALGHTHDFDNFYSSDWEGHWHACSGCGERGNFAEHFYLNNCEATCTICGYVREVEHNYSNRLSYDETGHWYACTVCGDILEKQPHVPGEEATETTDQICLDCGFIIQAAHSHVHAPNGDLLANESTHWHQCACGEVIDLDLHTWSEGVEDTTQGTMTWVCAVCGYSRVELLPDDYQPGDPTLPDSTEPEQSGSTGQQSQNQQTGVQSGTTDPGKTGQIAWWWYVIIVVGVLILGAVIFVIIGILVSRKQVGKFSSK